METNILTEVHEIHDRLYVLKERVKADNGSLKRIDQLIERVGAIEAHLALCAGVDA